MSLKTNYEAFLGSPTVAALAENAALHYVPTLTTANDGNAVIRRLKTSNVKRREERVLNAIEAQSALVVEVETTLEFVHDGGAYLPGLDGNFLADRVVTVLVVCSIPSVCPSRD